MFGFHVPRELLESSLTTWANSGGGALLESRHFLLSFFVLALLGEISLALLIGLGLLREYCAL
jgi:hypothetical protein